VVEEGSAFPVKDKAKSSHTHLHHLLQGQHHDGRRHGNTVILHPARCEGQLLLEFDPSLSLSLSLLRNIFKNPSMVVIIASGHTYRPLRLPSILSACLV